MIIPTKDRPDDLRRCINGISGQVGLAGHTQIIVIDDYSSHPYLDAVREQAQRQNLDLLAIENTGPPGAAVARNLAAQVAVGNILAFLDDDAVPQPGWICALLHAFDDPDCSAVTGRILPCMPQDMISRARQARYDCRRADAMAGSGKVLFMAGGNGAVRRNVFEQLGGFDTRMEQMHDSELIIRLNRMGLSCRYLDDLEIHHRHSKGLGSMFRTCFTSARYRRLMESLHPEIPRFTLRNQLYSVRKALRNCSGNSDICAMVSIMISELTHRIGYACYWRVGPAPFHDEQPDCKH